MAEAVVMVAPRAREVAALAEARSLARRVRRAARAAFRRVRAAYRRVVRKLPATAGTSA